MQSLVENIRSLKVDFDDEQQWCRYVDGDFLYNVIDERSANSVKSYVSDLQNDMSLDEIHKFFNAIMRAFFNITIDKTNKSNNAWLKSADQVLIILTDAKKAILQRWTEMVYRKCGSDVVKSEIVSVLDFLTLSFWRSSAERKGKIVFFPNIHIEIVPFLQSLRVVQYNERYIDELQKVLAKYPLEFLYEYTEPEELSHSEREECIPDIKVEKEKPAKKKIVRKKSKKGLTNAIELALKTGEKRKRHKSGLSQRTLLSRSPSVKREEHIKSNLYSDVTPLWKKSATKEKTTDGTDHRIDFGTEAYLGPIYHIASFESGKKSQKYGSWNITLDSDLEERELNGESIQVSLKVPVEEVFLGSNEPVVAFRDNISTEWKKGVFTTHTQFDQNTFIVSTRLSKMGYVSLFQHNDFHYPYKKWYVKFEEKKVFVRIHTNVVELAFVIEGNYFHLDTLTGDEFSKLRSLHQKKMSLSEMIMKLEKHGVHIVPNAEIINKHRDTKKDLELEIYSYRLICLNQIDCESSRMNSTVSMETVVITLDGAPRNISTKSPGKFYANFGDSGKKRKIHENNLTPATLFQFLMVTRPLVVTK